MAAELDGISDQQSDGGAGEVRGLGLLHYKGACKVTPAVGGTVIWLAKLGMVGSGLPTRPGH
jgi:hypothetical protein